MLNKNDSLTKHNQISIGGFYEHYKGKQYQVIDIVRHSETLEEMVLYKSLYKSDLGPIWVRPKEMFLESLEIDGVITPRFKEITKT